MRTEQGRWGRRRALEWVANADAASWRRAIVILAAVAFVLRIAIAAVTGGNQDLRQYYEFAHLAAGGHNPYHPPSGFPLPARLGDNLPGELIPFAAVLKLHDDAFSLRVLFAAADAGVILLVGLCFLRPRVWRAAFVLLYAFNPLVLGSWTATAEDKSLLFLGMAGLVLALERGSALWSWAGTTALAAFKGFTLFFAPMLALHTARTRGWRPAALYAAGSAAVLAVTHLPWFPDAFEAYSRRADRTDAPVPYHAALTQVLDKLGIYDPAIPRFGVPLLLAGIFLLVWRDAIGIVEALVLSSAVTLVLQPDHSYPRALFAALPFVFVLRSSARRWTVIWAVSSVAAVVIYLQQEHGKLGGYGSFPHALAGNALFVVVLAYYVIDKAAGTRVPESYAAAASA